ncbi:neuralized-like protein 1A [Elysia marginata]|uniref:Neuralized-like protein 1A n=1 Tax=Elysia marginata TaxID=1093978 RepID=A0AAV4H7S0_9GAST|nr:neuralized-like protein 1A [Elysia marginata]
MSSSSELSPATKETRQDLESRARTASDPPTATAEGATGSTYNNENQAGAMAGKENNHATESQMLDTVMQRMKSDLMYELRHLQHGDRPVTGQGHRDSLHQFMLKNLDSQSQHNVTANRDLVEEHRPEAVVVEVQGIIERRPVSSVLQSPAFRRQLENVIRGGLVSAGRSRRITTTAATAGANRHDLLHQRQRQSANAVLPRPARRSPRPTLPDTASSEPTVSNTEEPVPAPLSRSESTESIDSFSSARSSTEQELDDYDTENVSENFDGAHLAANSAEPRALPQPRPRSSVTNRVSPVPHSPPEPVPAQEQSSNSPRVELGWHDISRVQREEMVQEISELLHSRLVSSTLESEFRATLELLAQEHVQSSGQNGQAVQEFIHTLPGRGIPRNDFSHMGIPAGAAGLDNDNWDNVSVASMSAHSVPYVQTNTYLGREIQSLRAQMTEMKSLLKLTFDLQMDIQRSIRQEVAAALNNIVGPNTLTSPGAAAAHPVNDTHCLICLDHHSDSVLYQCGHMCVCYMCGRDLVARGHSCPVCRAPIKDVIRAYKTNAE